MLGGTTDADHIASRIPLLPPPQARPEWRDNYLQYTALKNLIKEAADEASGLGQNVTFSPRTTSLTVARGSASKTADERFYELLEAEMTKINRFTVERVSELKKRLKALRVAVGGGGAGTAANGDPEAATTEALMAEAKDVGDEFLALEKYVSRFLEGEGGGLAGGVFLCFDALFFFSTPAFPPSPNRSTSTTWAFTKSLKSTTKTCPTPRARRFTCPTSTTCRGCR